MHSNQVFKSIFYTLLFFTLSQVPSLEAMGWGKSEELFDFEGTPWNGIYLDVDGLSLTASVPNYDGASLQNNEVNVNGKVADNIGYVITTSMNSGFSPPKTSQEYIKIIQDANLDFSVVSVNLSIPGIKYVVDLVPQNQADPTFWRILSTKDRLIKMGTADNNANRRLKFFESLRIKGAKPEVQNKVKNVKKQNSKIKKNKKH